MLDNKRNALKRGIRQCKTKWNTILSKEAIGAFHGDGWDIFINCVQRRG
jgi:hypothetical protein